MEALKYACIVKIKSRVLPKPERNRHDTPDKNNKC